MARPDFDAIAEIVSAQHIAHPSNASVPRDSITQLNQFLRNLDPYSRYLSAEEFAEESVGGNRQKRGIGGLVAKEADGVLLVPFSGAPASKAGIEVPVEILTVNEHSAEDLSMATMRELFDTKTRVTLRVRDFVDQITRTVEITPGPYDVPPVETYVFDTWMLIRVHFFIQRRTQDDLRTALLKSYELGKRPVLDLRYATGGSVYEALDAISLFLPLERAIASTVESSGKDVPFHSQKGQSVVHGPLLTLVGPSTASSAELFVRALQYWGYALVIGQPTVGKCVMQRFFPLQDGEGLRLTVGRILDPIGRDCHGLGISPDVPVPSRLLHDTKRLLDIGEAYNRDAMLICTAAEYESLTDLERDFSKLGLAQDDRHQPVARTVGNKLHLCLAPAILSSVAKLFVEQTRTSEVPLILLSIYDVPASTLTDIPPPSLTPTQVPAPTQEPMPTQQRNVSRPPPRANRGPRTADRQEMRPTTTPSLFLPPWKVGNDPLSGY